MRSVKKAIEEYKARYHGTHEGSFYLKDFRQIMEVSRDMDPADTLFNCVDNALMFGFMTGYRKAQADAKKKVGEMGGSIAR